MGIEFTSTIQRFKYVIRQIRFLLLLFCVRNRFKLYLVRLFHGYVCSNSPALCKRRKKMNFKSSLLMFCRTILYLIMGYFRMWSTRFRNNNNDNNIYYKNETPKVTTSSKQTMSMAADKFFSPPKLSIRHRVYINITSQFLKVHQVDSENFVYGTRGALSVKKLGVLIIFIILSYKIRTNQQQISQKGPLFKTAGAIGTTLCPPHHQVMSI